MASSDTEGVLTVVDDWDPDLVDEQNSPAYRHGEEITIIINIIINNNTNNKDTESDADAMLGLAMGESAECKSHIEGIAPAYLVEIASGSMLCIENNQQEQQVYKKDELFGLFSIFVAPLLKYHAMQWTDSRLEKVRHPPLTVVEFDIWIGLQLAMSIVPLSSICNF